MMQDLLAAGFRLQPDDGFVGHAGGLWQRTIDRQVQFAFVATEIHTNRNGLVHGGMLMTFMDRALGQTAREATGAVRGATVSLTHQFLAPVRINDIVKLTPQVTSKTGRMVFMTGTALIGDVPVVSAQGVWRMSFNHS